MSSTDSVIMVALLAIAMKNHNIPQKRLDEQGIKTERCWTRYSGGYSTLSPWNKIPALRVGITTFSVQMATCGVANRLGQHGMQRAVRKATYIISSNMCVFRASARERTWRLSPFRQASPPAGSEPISLAQRCEHRGSDAEHWSCHVPWVLNVIRHIPYVVSDLPKPDLFHSLQIGMHDHIQK